MAWIGKKIICPYCMEELYEKDLIIKCKNCNESDMVKGSGNPFAPVLRCKRPGCNNRVASLVLCGKCEEELPTDIMSYEKYLRFSLLGTTGSGKTNFITTMIYELMHSKGCPLIIEPMNWFTRKTYQDNYEKIYANRTPVDPTPPGQPPVPMQWRIKDMSREGRRGMPLFSMTIFDGAGEDGNHPVDVVSRYLSGSKSLIILFDPLALKNVCVGLPKDKVEWSSTAEIKHDDPVFLINGIASYIRDSCAISASKKIDCEVAVVFTKIDMLRDSFRNSTVMRPSPHVNAKGFVLADSDEVNREIEDWLRKNNEDAFIKALEANFKKEKIRYFGVSSFGNPPTGDKCLGIVMPHRVLDPLMWLLYREKIIPGI